MRSSGVAGLSVGWFIFSFAGMADIGAVFAMVATGPAPFVSLAGAAVGGVLMAAFV